MTRETGGGCVWVSCALASPGAQRNFKLAGGSLLTAASLWALMARRPA